jgi:integrase
MPTMDSIQIKPRDAGRPIMLLQYSSARVRRSGHWPWVAPQEHRWINTKTQKQGRHHMDESLVQQAVGDAVAKVGLTKRATCPTVRHAFVTHVLEGGCEIRTVQELLEHRDVKTMMIDVHMLNRRPTGVRSPLDGMRGYLRWC